MPHISIKLAPGRSEEQKRRLTEQITKDVMAIAGADEGSISVRIEEVNAQDWTEQVYKPEILPHLDKLYKKPGYV